MDSLIIPQSLRADYENENRSKSIAKITTRVPYILRAELHRIASHPQFGYRSLAHMLSACFVAFQKDEPWKRGFAWRVSSEPTEFVRSHLAGLTVTQRNNETKFLKRSASKKEKEVGEKTASSEMCTFHCYFEPYLDREGKMWTAKELRVEAEHIADKECTNKAAVALTFLWYIVLVMHRLDNDEMIKKTLLATPGARNYLN